jgi:hypothetical protein
MSTMVFAHPIPTNFSLHVNSCLNIKNLYLPYEINEFKGFRKNGSNLESFDIDWGDLPKLKNFSFDHIPDNPAFEEYIDKKRDKERREKYFPSDEGYESDEGQNQAERTIPAANFKEPADKNTLTKLTISHMRITGKLVIKD